MGFFKDVLNFERFALKDMLGTIRKDPERLFLGALDPFSTRMWNKTGIGKDWEPVVDQFGGPYSGKSLGGGNGGVYARAQAAGVPTGPGGQMHDIARTIAGTFAGGYGLGKVGSMANNSGPLQWLNSPSGPLGGTGGWAGGGQYPPWMTPPFNPNAPAPVPMQAPPAMSRGPAWLQKFGGGMNKLMGGMSGGPSPYLSPSENAALQERQRMAMIATLLQSSQPRPKGTVSPIADFGTAMLAGQQAGDQFTADALRAKLMQSQMAQAQQGAQDPAAIREMVALGFPLTEEGFKAYNAAQARPGTTINVGESELDKPIPIAQLDSVRLPNGETPPLGTTMRQAREMGARVLSTEDQKRTQQADQALGILNQLEEMAIGPDGVFKEVQPGLANRAAAAIDFGLNMMTQNDPRASQFHDMSQATLAPFIKFLGETGSLAQGDVQRAIGLLPRTFPLPDTEDVARKKLTELREIITRGVNKMNSVTRQSESVPPLPPGYTLDPE